MILKYTSKIDATLAKVQETMNELKTITSLHEQKLETHDEEIGHLKQKAFTVNYRK